MVYLPIPLPLHPELGQRAGVLLAKALGTYTEDPY